MEQATLGQNVSRPPVGVAVADLEARNPTEYHPQVDSALESMERAFTVGGRVPFVSILTGSCRALVGVIELVVALGNYIRHKLAPVLLLSHKNINVEQQHKNQAELMKDYMKHGLQNIARGIIEAIPVVGNATCGAYDHFTKTEDKHFYPTRAPGFEMPAAADPIVFSPSADV